VCQGLLGPADVMLWVRAILASLILAHASADCFQVFPSSVPMIRLFFPLGSYVVSSILLPHSFLSRNPPCARFFLGTRPHSLHQETLPIPPEGRLPAGVCHLPTTNRPTLIISHVDPPAIRDFLCCPGPHRLWAWDSPLESTNVRRGVGSEALVGCPILAPPFGESPFSFLPPPIGSNSFPLFSFLATHRLPFAGIRPHPFFPIRPRVVPIFFVEPLPI
jgi:hypothetical protein